MDFPRNLNLDQDVKMKLISYLDEEIEAHMFERGTWVQDLRAWQQDYWATPATKEATFPFKGAANIVIPLTAIAVESVHAREMTTLFALNQFVSTQIISPLDQDLTYDLDKSIDQTLLKDADIYKFADTSLLERKKLGVCVGKSGYEKIVKTAIKEIGGVETEFQVVTKQGPFAACVPVANYMMPFTAVDPQESPWCGEEHLANIYQLRQMIDSGLFYDDVEKKLTNYYNFLSQQDLSSAPYTQTVRNLQNQVPTQFPREIGWHEIWLAFNIDGNEDGKQHEIVVHYHRMAQLLMSVRYNWNDDLHRPYRLQEYFPMEHRWAGIGIGKQNEQFQLEVTTQHRQRIDNATIANLRMFKVKQGIGIGPDEPIFPGKIWLLDEMDDVDSIQIAEVYPSSYNNEQQAVIYSQQRTGVNELSLGMPQAGTPGTATGDLTRVQEFNRKFDYTYKGARRFLTDIVKDILCEQSQFGFRDVRYFDTLGENGQRIKQILQSPCEDIRSELIFNIQLVGQNSNRMIDRNNYTQYAGMLTQYYTQMITLAQQFAPQLVAQIVAKAMQAGTEAMKQISEGFDIRGLDRFLLPPSIVAMLQGPNGSNAIRALPGAGQGATGTSEAQGVSNPVESAAAV